MSSLLYNLWFIIHLISFTLSFLSIILLTVLQLRINSDDESSSLSAVSLWLLNLTLCGYAVTHLLVLLESYGVSLLLRRVSLLKYNENTYYFIVITLFLLLSNNSNNNAIKIILMVPLSLYSFIHIWTTTITFIRRRKYLLLPIHIQNHLCLMAATIEVLLFFLLFLSVNTLLIIPVYFYFVKFKFASSIHTQLVFYRLRVFMDELLLLRRNSSSSNSSSRFLLFVQRLYTRFKEWIVNYSLQDGFIRNIKGVIEQQQQQQRSRRRNRSRWIYWFRFRFRVFKGCCYTLYGCNRFNQSRCDLDLSIVTFSYTDSDIKRCSI
jgi:hypothetical protein